ncbi:acyltransferase family protein [Bacteroides sp.]|uniref:acyltransferase family protein n=1 Tax=Bacteroides sp. TaxID=29523 RepID=UPI0025B9A8FA|nr:acyltransferase family protein [Bacteroides sp.]
MRRIDWIDYGKVIGIYLVVLGHTNLFFSFKDGIYIFHMPVFFFISGYLFSFSRNPVYKDFVKKRFRQLIIPYVWINIITYLFWFVLGRHFGDDANANIPWYDPLIGALLGNGSKLIHDVPIWFLVCLFVVENLFYLLFKRIKHFWIGLIIFIMVAYLNYTFNPYLMPFSFNTAIVAMIFYVFGYMMKEKEFFRKSNVLYLIIALGILIWASILNGRVEMYKNFYNNYFLFLLGGTAGIIFIVNICLYLSSWFGDANWIKYLSNNTIIISGFHLMTFSFIKAVMVYILSIPLTVLEGKIGVNILFSIISMILCLPLIFFINKYCPFIIGRKFK